MHPWRTMPEPESRDRTPRKGSLPSDATARADDLDRREGGGLSEAAERHRLARLRREAHAQSPLLSALSRPSRPAEDETYDAEERELRAIFAEREAESHAASEAQPVASSVEEPARRADQPPVRRARRGGSAAMPAQASGAVPPSGGGDNPYWRPLIDPMKVISGIVKSRWIIVGTTILGGLLGAAIAVSTPKVYQSRAELLIDPRDLRIVDRDLTGGGLPSDATLAIVENQVRVMTSGTVVGKVVDKLGLDRDAEFNGQARGGGIGGLLSGLRSLISPGSGTDGGADRRRALAIEHLYKALDVERGGKTFVVSVRATTQSPDKSALIANTVTDVFLETYGAIQAGTAGRASDELGARLSELRSGLEDAERKVEAFKSENDIVDAQGRLITDDEILKLNDQLATARARTLELDARAQSARSASVDTLLTGNLPEQMSSPVLTELRSQYAALRQQADRLSAKLGPRHPERMAVDAQVAAAREQIGQELRLVASSIQVDLKRAVQLEQELAARLAQLKGRQANLSGELVTLRELEREATAKRAVYEAFLLRARETGEQRDINTANMSVISQATPPLTPSGMSRTTQTIIAAMLGFAAGVGIGAARGAVDSVRGGGDTPRPSRSRPLPDTARRPDEDEEQQRAAYEPADVAQRDAAAPQPTSRAADDEQAAEETAMNRMQPHPAWPMPDRPPAQPYQGGWPQQPQQWPDPGAPMQPAWQGQPWGAQADPRTMAQPPMYPGAPAHAAQPYAPQPHAYPQAQPYQPWPQDPAYGQPAQGYAPQYQSGWQPPMQPPMGQPAGQHAYAPPYPQQGAVYGAPHEQQRSPEPRPAEMAAESDRDAIAEIRESLREFREALKDLAESRSRRRFL